MLNDNYSRSHHRVDSVIYSMISPAALSRVVYVPANRVHALVEGSDAGIFMPAVSLTVHLELNQTIDIAIDS